MAGNQLGGKSIGEKEWRPHIVNVETNPNICFTHSRVGGPDWISRLRCSKKVKSGDCLTGLEKSSTYTGRKHYPWETEQTSVEWIYYADGSKTGKRCFIDDHYPGKQSYEEEKLEKKLGLHAQVFDKRGNIPCISPGDKSYSTPEYSKDFHKEGSTLPAVNFRCTEQITDTFIPLQPLPRQPSATFNEKEEVRKLNEERDEVSKLDDWIPAPPISAGL